MMDVHGSSIEVDLANVGWLAWFKSWRHLALSAFIQWIRCLPMQ